MDKYCKKSFLVCTVLALTLIAGGCKPKQQSTLDQPVPEPEPAADTTFAEPQTFGSVDTTDEAVFSEADLDAAFKKQVEENLKPVYFEYNSYSLTPESGDNLAKAAAFLREHGSVRVLIEGHCDERGSSEYNMGLGENRSRAVKDYLVNFGIPAMQMEITSYGKERLAEYGCMDDGCHALNRRAEFKVLSK